MTVRLLRPGEEPAFDAFVRAHPDGTPFHLTAWRDLVAGSFGHRPEYLVAEEGGLLCGVLPLFALRSPLLGRAYVSVPYGVYGGILAAGPAEESALLAAACRRADAADARYLELRNLRVGRSDLPRSELYVTFLRDLPGRAEDCLGMIPRKSRASTRHARDRHQMELVEGRACLDGFYELFVQNKRGLGSPVFARSFFARLLDRFGAEALLHGVRCEGRIVAGVLSFVFRDTLMPYYSGSEEAAERLGSMNFMYWKLMEAGVERGLKRFDFGRSRVGTGAAAFKENMGFAPTPLHYEYYLRRGAQIPSVNPSNPRFDVAKRLWRRLPLPLVRMVGPLLMKYLP